MSVHKREEILERMVEVLQENVEGIQAVFRNRGLLGQDKLPALAVLDGDEVVEGNVGRGRPNMTAVLTKMRPQVFILVKDTTPVSATVGTDINTLRGRVIKAIAQDMQLQALAGPNGAIQYEGLETDLKTGMEMRGSMQLQFAITYVMNPNAN